MNILPYIPPMASIVTRWWLAFHADSLFITCEIFDFRKYGIRLVCFFVCFFVCLFFCQHDSGRIVWHMTITFFLWIGSQPRTKWFAFGQNRSKVKVAKKSRNLEKSLSHSIGRFSKIYNFVNTEPIHLKFGRPIHGDNRYWQNKFYPDLIRIGEMAAT